MNSTTTAQKIGWVIFTIGAVYMIGLGWLYSWRVVPAANQLGSDAYASLLGLIWALSVPLGAFIVAIGAALSAKVERRVFWLLILLVLLFTAWRISGTTGQMIPALFGIGGGLITLFFIGSVWQWARIRPTLSGAGKTGSDLRMVGYIFFVVAAWDLCGIFGIANFVLRPELAEQFSIPISNTISSASAVSILLALGWGFTYFGQLVSRRAQAVDSKVELINVSSFRIHSFIERKIANMNKKGLALCGVLAPIVFTLALVAFSLFTPNYSNLTNFVSELGTLGAPYALAWNTMGFVLVGLLVVAFAWGLHINLRPGLGASIVPSFVAITGLAFAGLGLFPAEADFQPSIHTTLHSIMVSISYMPFILVTFIFVFRLKADPFWKRWIPFTIIMGIVGLLSFFIPKTIPVGLSQRIGLGAYFIWVFGMGYALLSKQFRTSP